EAVRESVRHRPDVLGVNLAAAELSAVCRDINQAAPGTAVLAFSDSQDDLSVLTAIRAGVLGYLPKTPDVHDLVRTVRSVAGGQAIFGPHVAGRVTELLCAHHRLPFPDLTSREREILAMMATGLPSAVIAQRLGLAVKTVRNHASGISVKIGATSREHAVELARAAGLGDHN
ncbi:MAG: response regulator transcription factor, partial [Kibdelosporangium sp.]